MRKFFSLIFLLAIALNFSSCEKDGIENLENISYGTSFGECFGYCTNIISVSNENVVFTKSKNGQTPDLKTCDSTISRADLEIIKTSLNESKVAKLPATIGCPDCADGGAEWVSITANGKTYIVVFEYGKAPAELAVAVTKLREIKETFKNCN